MTQMIRGIASTVHEARARQPTRAAVAVTCQSCCISKQNSCGHHLKLSCLAPASRFHTLGR